MRQFNPLLPKGSHALFPKETWLELPFCQKVPFPRPSSLKKLPKFLFFSSISFMEKHFFFEKRVEPLTLWFKHEILTSTTLFYPWKSCVRKIIKMLIIVWVRSKNFKNILLIRHSFATVLGLVLHALNLLLLFVYSFKITVTLLTMVCYNQHTSQTIQPIWATCCHLKNYAIDTYSINGTIR